MTSRGGTLTRADLAAYATVPREPVHVRYHGREVLTNPPPSAGGILIAYALALLERGVRPAGARTRSWTRWRRPRPSARRRSSRARPSRASWSRSWRSRLGSTTHVSVLDADGWACAVTTTNGEGSGLVVPGTGIHVNNMMGEQDLSPAGWFTHPPGRRLPSMMAPTIVLDDGSPELVLGSAGSNRIRSAIVQVIVNAIDRGMDAQAAVDAPRLHFEDGLVYAEPGIDADALEAAGRRWPGSATATCSSAAARRSSATTARASSAAEGIRAGEGRWSTRDRDHLRHVRRVQRALQQVGAGLGEAAPVAAAVGQPRRAEPERAGGERDVVLDAALGEAPADDRAGA